MRTRAIWPAAALALAACGGGDDEADMAELPLILESPNVAVVSGADTLRVYAPTVVVYFATGVGDAEPTPALIQAAESFQATLREATPGLEAMGLRITPVGDVPRPLGISPEVDQAAGPPLPPGSAGFLLVHPGGRIVRVERTASGLDLVCAAARFFEATPPAQVGLSCR